MPVVLLLRGKLNTWGFTLSIDANSRKELLEALTLARADYLDNQSHEDADFFYAAYFKAYNDYWRLVDPSKMQEKWT